MTAQPVLHKLDQSGDTESGGVESGGTESDGTELFDEEEGVYDPAPLRLIGAALAGETSFIGVLCTSQGVLHKLPLGTKAYFIKYALLQTKS